MTINRTAAYGLYGDDVALPEIVSILNDAGFGNEDICMMLSPTHPMATMVRDANILNTERESVQVSAGVIGWLSGLGAVLIPTIGFFIRSQAFFHALVVAKHAPALCGGSGSLVALGFHEDEAERLEDQLYKDGALMYVSCPESAQMNWAIELLHRTGARETAILERQLAAGAVA
jgi:hypothetical protein